MLEIKNTNELIESLSKVKVRKNIWDMFNQEDKTMRQKCFLFILAFQILKFSELDAVQHITEKCEEIMKINDFRYIVVNYHILIGKFAKFKDIFMSPVFEENKQFIGEVTNLVFNNLDKEPY